MKKIIYIFLFIPLMINLAAMMIWGIMTTQIYPILT